MRTLILFATKYGTADKCAHLLKCQLDGEVTIQPIDAAESLNGYDTVVIGGSIYMGKLQPTVIRFCRQNQALLLKKKNWHCIYAVSPAILQRRSLKSIFLKACLIMR